MRRWLVAMLLGTTLMITGCAPAVDGYYVDNAGTEHVTIEHYVVTHVKPLSDQSTVTETYTIHDTGHGTHRIDKTADIGFIYELYKSDPDFDHLLRDTEHLGKEYDFEQNKDFDKVTVSGVFTERIRRNMGFDEAKLSRSVFDTAFDYVIVNGKYFLEQ